MPKFLDENQVEVDLIRLLTQLGYHYISGANIGPDPDDSLFQPERNSFGEVFLLQRMRAALARINPQLDAEGIDTLIRTATRPATAELAASNRAFHKMLVEGVPIRCRRKDGRSVTEHAHLMDFNHPGNNDLLVVNQFTVVENKHNRRPDVVVFINGFPLVVIELKNPANVNATIKTAFKQLQTYKLQIPSLFLSNALLVISDGTDARTGTLTADWERFMPWRTLDGLTLAAADLPRMEVLATGMLQPARLLDLIRRFTVFEDGDKTLQKKIAAYHQYFAVNKAVECTLSAARPAGDRRIGVVWHTQGSGKSLTMAFYAGKIIHEAAMENPTLVVLTDRNDLDDQLFGTFSRCRELFSQTPAQAENRPHLRELLNVAAGGVIFTTLQKFLPENKGDRHPLLSDRRNIVVIADEAHRGQYDFIDGFARHLRDALPQASFIGFTGTPLDRADKNTRGIFGEYVDIYDIQQAVEDRATVPISYEGRLAKLQLSEAQRPHLDSEFEEVTEGEEARHKARLKSKWASLEAMVGATTRTDLLARDLLAHFESRLSVMEGKGMIVCMSRRICVELYAAIVKLRPDWHNTDDDKGEIKIVMTGNASDPLDWQQHIRNKARRERLADRFKASADPLKLVLVRDMWLTGFDAPCLHTMYLDKPMQGHSLMQAIARVNRVFKDKPGGLVVDYLGLADELKNALSQYTQSGGKGHPVVDQEQTAKIALEKFAATAALFSGFDYRTIIRGPDKRKLAGTQEAVEHILAQDDGRKNFLKAVAELSKAFALAVPHETVLSIRDDVGFFQAVRAVIVKITGDGGDAAEKADNAIRDIVSRAVVSDQVVDIFAAAGLKKPDLSILSPEFLADVRELPQKNLALEMLRKLLNDEITVIGRGNVVRQELFSDMLEAAIRKYQNRTLDAAQVIAELIELAKRMNAERQRGKDLGLSAEETAFYDALETNDSAVKLLGEPTLKKIARELVRRVKENVTIDWEVRATAQAKIRVIVKHILREFGYPPDKEEKAAARVLEQARLHAQNLLR